MIFNLSGGGPGAFLNFRVVGGTTAPSNPAENTIWVNTDTPVTDWIFSPTVEYDTIAGTVWLLTSISTGVQFNALKKNDIRVFPVSCRQHVEGVGWVEKTAKIYQNGKWLDWRTYLYNNGDTCDSITGGYEEVIYHGDGTHGGASTMNSDSIYVYAYNQSTGHIRCQGRSTVNPIDLTNVKTIRAVGNCTQASSSSGVAIRAISAKSLKDTAAAEIKVNTTGAFDISLDVSALSGSYYVIPYAQGYSNHNGEGTFSQIWYQT